MDGDAGHRLRQRRRSELAVLQHLEARRDLRDDDLVDVLPLEAVLREDLVRHVLDDRVARDADVLALQALDVCSTFRLARDKLVTAVCRRGDLDIKAAILRKSCGEHIGDRTVEVAALQRRVAIHRALELLKVDVEPFIREIALFLCNQERQGVGIRHQADGEFLHLARARAPRGAASAARDREHGDGCQTEAAQLFPELHLLLHLSPYIYSTASHVGQPVTCH